MWPRMPSGMAYWRGRRCSTGKIGRNIPLYERRIESSLSRARSELRLLRRQPQRAAHSGAASVEERWDDSGGYSQASPGAGADLGPETADSA